MPDVGVTDSATGLEDDERLAPGGVLELPEAEGALTVGLPVPGVMSADVENDPVLEPEAGNSLDVEFVRGNGAEDEGAVTALELEAFPPAREVEVVNGVGVRPGNKLDVAEEVRGDDIAENTVLVPGRVLPAAVSEDGGMLNGAGDPIEALEVVPFAGGDGTLLVVDGTDAVELNRGNGAEPERPVDPGSRLPVDRGPTVSVKEGLVITAEDEPPVTGGYPDCVV